MQSTEQEALAGTLEEAQDELVALQRRVADKKAGLEGLPTEKDASIALLVGDKEELKAALGTMEVELVTVTTATKSSQVASVVSAVEADLTAAADARVGALEAERTRAQALVYSLGQDMAAVRVGDAGGTAAMEGRLREAAVAKVAALNAEQAKAMALVKGLEEEPTAAHQSTATVVEKASVPTWTTA